MAIFSTGDLAVLSRLHVQQFWLVHVFFPEGQRRFHTGPGPLIINGVEWQGVSDPYGGQLVALDGIEEPRFGQAMQARALFSGANRAFLHSMWRDAEEFEGCRCDVYRGVMDAETGEMLIAPKRVMRGALSVPKFNIVGASIRSIEVPIVSVWEGLNFPTAGSDWTPTGQRYRFAGDKGLDFIGSNVVEVYLP